MSTKETLGVKLPEVKFNKNGYEIRTEILEMAQSLVGQDRKSTRLNSSHT